MLQHVLALPVGHRYGVFSSYVQLMFQLIWYKFYIRLELLLWWLNFAVLKISVMVKTELK